MISKMANSTSSSSLASLIIIFSALLFIDHVSAHGRNQQQQLHPRRPINSLVNGKIPTVKATNMNNMARKQRFPTFAADFVAAHNMIRLSHGHAPLKWNYTLAYYAKQWAKKRVQDCKLIHSYGPYGENLFWGGRTDWTPLAVVKSWSEEKAFYDPKSNKCKDGEMCGHYTQVIWSNTASVGCARVSCSNNKGLYVICNYDPPGNYIGEHPFGSAVNKGGNSSKNSSASSPKKQSVDNDGNSSRPPKPFGFPPFLPKPHSK